MLETVGVVLGVLAGIAVVGAFIVFVAGAISAAWSR